MLKDKGIDSFTAFALSAATMKELVNTIAASPGIIGKLKSGKVADAADDAFLLFVKSDTFKNDFFKTYTNWCALQYAQYTANSGGSSFAPSSRPNKRTR
ncbi:MAG: hypothetical protein QM758_29070 [Armatimonas sp.]